MFTNKLCWKFVPVCQFKATTMEEDQELLVDFSSILWLCFEIQDTRTYNFFLLSFKYIWLKVTLTPTYTPQEIDGCYISVQKQQSPTCEPHRPGEVTAQKCTLVLHADDIQWECSPHWSQSLWKMYWSCTFTLVNLHGPQIAKTLKSTLIRHCPDTEVSDRCLINVDPRVFAIWVSTSSI